MYKYYMIMNSFLYCHITLLSTLTVDALCYTSLKLIRIKLRHSMNTCLQLLKSVHECRLHTMKAQIYTLSRGCIS